MANEVIGKGWITVAAINDGKPGAPGEPGTPGKPGSDGLTVTASPAVIVLKAVKVANGSYKVQDYSSARSQIRVSRGGKDVTAQCALTAVRGVNCTASVSGQTVSVTAVSQQTVAGMKIPYTARSVTVTGTFADGGRTVPLSVTILVKVEVGAVWGGIETGMSQLSTRYTELSNTVDGMPLKTDGELVKYTSEMKQSAREISAKVAQETVGRQNLLPGTAFNRETDVEQLNSYFPCTFEPLGGLEGTGAVVMSQTGASVKTWCGVKWEGVVLEPKTAYTISVWARADGGIDDVMYLGLRQVGASNALCYLLFARANETHEWKLYTETFTTGSTAESCNNMTLELGMRKNGVGRCCKLMLDESDTYNGWTAASYADVSSRALEATGIDIKNKTIDMTADKFTLRNNHGEKSFDVDSDGNVVARSLTSTSRDGKLTVTVRDGAFIATTADSLASAFIGLVDGMPRLQFTNALGVVTYSIGATGPSAVGAGKVTKIEGRYTVMDMEAVSPTTKTYSVMYNVGVTYKNVTGSTMNVMLSEFKLSISGFTGELTATASSATVGGQTVTTSRPFSVNPNQEAVLKFSTSEAVAKYGAGGIVIARPSGAVPCKVTVLVSSNTANGLIYEGGASKASDDTSPDEPFAPAGGATMMPESADI